jgi:hypothetical protein
MFRLHREKSIPRSHTVPPHAHGRGSPSPSPSPLPLYRRAIHFYPIATACPPWLGKKSSKELPRGKWAEPLTRRGLIARMDQT